MNRSRAFFSIYLAVVVAGVLLLAEVISRQILRSDGVELSFLVAGRSVDAALREGEGFDSLDPHLGYARDDRDRKVDAFRDRYVWRGGFAIYKPAAQPIDRPIILTLGGSTTDPLEHETSWPEELARLLVEEGSACTVINGATEGYSSSQELLKLIRDGLELEPDLVISYSGVNDRGAYGALPHPMVHRYQRYVLDRLTQSPPSPLLPNTIALLRSLGRGDEGGSGYTLGLETERSLADWYLRNLSLMNAVSTAADAEFIGVTQPNAYVGGYRWPPAGEEGGKPQGYVLTLEAFYEDLQGLASPPGYVHGFLSIFDGIQGVYRGDGVHTTRKGDRIIAERMLALIRSETKLLQPAAASDAPIRSPAFQTSDDVSVLLTRFPVFRG